MNIDSKFVLAIDLGTSGPKVGFVSANGKILGTEFCETKLILLPNGGAEQDPNEWWDAIMQACKKVLEKNLVNKDDIVAISVTSQWSGTVAIDKDKNPLGNAIIWMDTRGAKYVNEIVKGPINFEGYGIDKAFKWIRKTGGIPGHSGKDPIAHILYIKNERKDIYKQTYKFLEPKDYINLKLTGKVAASFDSIALTWVTDNRDIANIKYDDQLIKLSTIDKDKLPELKKATDILGPIIPQVAQELGLNSNIPVIMGTPDIQSASLGSGAVKDYQAHLYIGTSSWIVCHVPYKKTDIFHNITTLPSPIDNRYFVANEQETAGACLTYLRDNILFHKDELLTGEKPPNVYKLFDQIVEKIPPGSDKLIFTPWLVGERTPIEDHTVRAGFYNQSLSTTRGHLIRAVYEGVAYNSKWLLTHVEGFVKKKFESINIIGGGANSDVWCQIFSDVLDRTIKQVDNPIEANLRGAGFLAFVALKMITFKEVSEYTPISKSFTPNNKNRQIYDMLFKEFLNIYKQNKKIFKRLNG